MERLTAYNSVNHKNVAYYPVCFQYPCNGFGCKIDGCKLDYEICQRLAAYEDTGLEPEEIYEVRFLIAAQRDPQKLARLRDLVLADEAGRLVVLPCKVGDTVYAAETSPAIPLSVAYVGVYLDGADGGDWEALENIGKTVFLTREEAEAALKGGGADA